MAKAGLAVLSILFAVLALGASCETEEEVATPATAKTSNATAKPVQTKRDIAQPDIAIDAGTLITEADNNPVATERKYKDRHLRVTGVIVDIAEDPWDSDIIVSVGPSEDWSFLDVNCEVDGSNEGQVNHVLALSERDRIAVRGRFNGIGILQEAELKDCEVVRQ